MWKYNLLQWLMSCNHFVKYLVVALLFTLTSIFETFIGSLSYIFVLDTQHRDGIFSLRSFDYEATSLNKKTVINVIVYEMSCWLCERCRQLGCVIIRLGKVLSVLLKNSVWQHKSCLFRRLIIKCVWSCLLESFDIIFWRSFCWVILLCFFVRF